MKYSYSLLLAVSVMSLAVVTKAAPCDYDDDNDNDNGNDNNTGNNNNTGAVTATGPVVGRGPGGAETANVGLPEGQDILLEINGGIPGNNCITFRNNGEMVQADCVETAADRKLKAIKFGGADALELQRTFVTPGFALKKGKICLANSGGKFRAEQCDEVVSSGFTFVTFDGDNLVDATNCITNDAIGTNPEMRTVARGPGDANCAVMKIGPPAV